MRSIGIGIEENIAQAIRALESEKNLSVDVRNTIAEGLKQAVKDINKVRSLIRSAESLAEIGVWEIDLQNEELFWSDEMYRILGYDPDESEASYQAYFNRIHPEDQEKVEQEYIESSKKNNPFEITYRIQLPDGQIKYVEVSATHFYNDEGEVISSIGISQDVTDRELTKKRIENSLEKNRTLLGEVHHRVKNNLAVVAGLLQMQWLQEDDPEVIKTLQKGANRMKAVAGIHEQLYQSGDFGDVALGENIKRLATDLISTMETDTKIDLMSSCDKVHLNMSQTLPCSLIANEVFTNIMKHAFEGKEKGKIEVILTKKDDQINLKISDNGVGLPKDYNSREGSLGMNLIEMLSSQLNADYSYNSSHEGTTFAIQFQKERMEE